MNAQAPGRSRRFSLPEGGPTFRIEKRLGLIRENSPRMLRRAWVAIGVTWVPLFALSLLQGNAIGHRVEVPFLRDFAVHARFLLSVPLLLLAETIVGSHWARAASHFASSGQVVDEDLAQFDAATKDGLALRDSTVPELVLIVLACAIAAITLESTVVHVSTWYALRTDAGVSLTWSGWWFVLFCVPLFQFLILRWLWWQFLWGQFLWRMSKLNLQLIPTHPDEAAGLAFVGEAQRNFRIVLIAYSIVVASVLANAVIYDKIPLRDLIAPIATYVIAAVAIVLAPLLVFLPMLRKTKRLGLDQYGTLGTAYTSSFHRKWILAPHMPQEPLLGTSDIQSLADLGNSFGIIAKMHTLPMGPRTAIHLAWACLIPMAPLLLTVMPLEEILKLLLKAVF
jgi:hypothetical protein